MFMLYMRMCMYYFSLLLPRLPPFFSFLSSAPRSPFLIPVA